MSVGHFDTQGLATYWHANVLGRKYSDVVCSFRKPLPGALKIARLLCFCNEQVDAVYVDGRRWIPENEYRLPCGGAS